MSGWYLTRINQEDGGRSAEVKVERAEKQFVKHGFSRFEHCRTTHHSFFFAYARRSDKSLFFRRGNDWIACAGTIAYNSLGGEQALESILNEFSCPYETTASLVGQYALIVYIRETLYVLTDFIGAFQLFHDSRYQTITTSLLSICAEQKSLSFNKQGVYEFAFTAFPLGNDTIFEQVSRLGPDRQLVLNEHVKFVETEQIKLQPLSDGSFDEQVDLHANNLLKVTENIVNVWGDNVRCPLSGGLDSRLVFALFRSQGVVPDLYVYGDEDSADVKIARLVTDRLKQDLDVINKDTHPELSGDALVNQVNLNFHECDGLVTDGGLFDSGAGSHTRMLRQKGNALAVSGGCGEVFRNFFFLRDKSFTPKEVVHAFYSRYDPQDLTAEFNADEYDHLISQKIRELLKIEEPQLSRQQVEALYPLMRCRAFFGREISIEGRQGDYFLPFLDKGVVSAALTIPLKYKTAGMIEAAILAKIAPDLAEMPSAYGHNFSGSISLSHRFSEYATLIRSPRLRKSSYVLRKKFGRPVSSKVSSDRNRALMSVLIDVQYPFMARFFKIDQIEDATLQTRISAIEYLAQHFGSLIESNHG